MSKVQAPTLAQKRRRSARIADIAAQIYCSKFYKGNGKLCSIEDSVERAAVLCWMADEKVEAMYGKVDVPSEDERGAKEDQPVPQGEAPDGRRSRKVRR
jgi:hypothetical protein